MAAAAVLWGPTATGKTSLGVAMMRARLAADFDRIAQGQHLFASAIELAAERSHHPLGVVPPLLRAALSADVLLLDDVGSEPARGSDAIVEIVMRRHDGGRPTWITTGVSAVEIGRRYGGGVERRLFEQAVIIRCDDDRRRA